MITRRQIGYGVVALSAAALAAKSASAQNCGVEGNGALLSREKVEAWLDGYRAAWEGRDADKAVALFTPDAKYRDQAFQPAMEGHKAIRDYWTNAVSDQSGVKFTSTLWSVSDTVATAHWTADFRLIKEDKPALLDGVFRLTFQQSDAGLLCSELLEWWFFQA